MTPPVGVVFAVFHSLQRCVLQRGLSEQRYGREGRCVPPRGWLEQRQGLWWRAQLVHSQCSEIWSCISSNGVASCCCAWPSLLCIQSEGMVATGFTSGTSAAGSLETIKFVQLIYVWRLKLKRGLTAFRTQNYSNMCLAGLDNGQFSPSLGPTRSGRVRAVCSVSVLYHASA